MTRILPPLTIKRGPRPEELRVDNNAHDGLIELLFAFIMSVIFVVCLALGAPEPVDCGVDRDAPTLEKGCGNE